MREGEKSKRVRSGRSLNLILWLAFSAFALLVIIFFLLIQNSLIMRQYRENTLAVIDEARGRMTSELDSAQNSYVLGRRLTDTAND